MTAVVSRSDVAVQSQDNGAHNPQLESYGGLEIYECDEDSIIEYFESMEAGKKPDEQAFLGTCVRKDGASASTHPSLAIGTYYDTEEREVRPLSAYKPGRALIVPREANDAGVSREIRPVENNDGLSAWQTVGKAVNDTWAMITKGPRSILQKLFPPKEPPVPAKTRTPAKPLDLDAALAALAAENARLAAAKAESKSQLLQPAA
ncbi:hypothetical protein [Bordetella sp. LUAb4]|uniref:hypothetical protein n=1 Tax=Bordetella sp. LUAb4 TaxID=2843195 RepID=UPI001E488462|nr:hypothetical protein [Bordetella sp. LUAb4]